MSLFITGNIFAGLVHLDYNPAPWRGAPGTTVQSWSFDNDSNPTEPDTYTNPNGIASLQITNGFPKTYWKPEDLGHDGVWKFEDEIIIDIPNYPDPNPYKEIWLQITFYAKGGIEPDLITLPGSDFMYLTDITPVDNYYYNATFIGTMMPNPPDEQIYIMPRDCTLYVDELVVDTICIPEPISIALFSIGALAIFRKKNKV